MFRNHSRSITFLGNYTAYQTYRNMLAWLVNDWADGVECCPCWTASSKHQGNRKTIRTPWNSRNVKISTGTGGKMCWQNVLYLCSCLVIPNSEPHIEDDVAQLEGAWLIIRSDNDYGHHWKPNEHRKSQGIFNRVGPEFSQGQLPQKSSLRLIPLPDHLQCQVSIFIWCHVLAAGVQSTGLCTAKALCFTRGVDLVLCTSGSWRAREHCLWSKIDSLGLIPFQTREIIKV